MDLDALRVPGKPSAKVQTIESQTGRESFFSYVMRHKEQIDQSVKKADNWQDIHRAFLQAGMVLKPSGNGLKIQDRFGKHPVKPSDIDRTWSKGNLVSKFGDFQEPSSSLFSDVKAISSYTAAPLQVGANRGNLYDTYQSDMRSRKDSIQTIKEELKSEIADTRRQ